jgi:hypothetical protein
VWLSPSPLDLAWHGIVLPALVSLHVGCVRVLLRVGIVIAMAI